MAPSWPSTGSAAKGTGCTTRESTTRHGVNLQGLIDPRRGDLVWISDGLPGSTHDLTAARTHTVITTAAHADVELYADKGYQGAGGTVTTPHKRRNLSRDQKVHNRMV